MKEKLQSHLCSIVDEVNELEEPFVCLLKGALNESIKKQLKESNCNLVWQAQGDRPNQNNTSNLLAVHFFGHNAEQLTTGIGFSFIIHFLKGKLLRFLRSRFNFKILLNGVSNMGRYCNERDRKADH